MPEEVLKVSKLSKQYVTENGIHTIALCEVDITVQKNEMLAVMGKSGSGKSTLINILTGVLPADEGQIWINDKDISTIPKKEMALFRRRNIGIIFQNYNLIDSLTISENIKVPLILDEQYDCQDEKVMQLASLLGIGEILEKYPYEVSGGQQQRAGICRALINEPGIIFADEPTGNLDALSTEQVMTSVDTVTYEYQTIALRKCLLTGLLLGCSLLVYCLFGLITENQRLRHNADGN